MKTLKRVVLIALSKLAKAPRLMPFGPATAWVCVCVLCVFRLPNCTLNNPDARITFEFNYLIFLYCSYNVFGAGTEANAIAIVGAQRD